ncbi:MAG: (Fe-S)-binding protein [Planctomycetota bacterium]|jgi:glycolate oxidase iron-sulfur subunit
MAIETKHLKKFENDVLQCMKCGFCAYFCPVFKEEKVEKSLARGKNYLVKGVLEGRQELTPGLVDVLNKCLLCKTCVFYCPAKARIDRSVTAARADLVAAKGLPWAKRFVFHTLLPHRRLFGTILRIASWFQWILPGQGKVRHLPEFLHALGRGRNIPTIAEVFLRESLPTVVGPPPGQRVRGRVAFFAGCAMEFMFPEKAIAMVDHLASLGLEVTFDRRQGCCGAPVYLSGDFETGRKMALKNVGALEKYDAVITGCATCTSGLKDYGQYLARDDAEKKRFEAFASKVRMYGEYLVDDLGIPDGGYRVREAYRGKKVTWHDPCHLSRHQEIRTQPREVLKNLEGVEYVEMPNADACCGLGGSFSIHYYELSKSIADQKLQGILKTGAEVVVTSCPGCIIQITDALVRNRHPIPVVHLADLIEPAGRAVDVAVEAREGAVP